MIARKNYELTKRASTATDLNSSLLSDISAGQITIVKSLNVQDLMFTASISKISKH